MHNIAKFTFWFNLYVSHVNCPKRLCSRATTRILASQVKPWLHIHQHQLLEVVKTLLVTSMADIMTSVSNYIIVILEVFSEKVPMFCDELFNIWWGIYNSVSYTQNKNVCGMWEFWSEKLGRIVWNVDNGGAHFRMLLGYMDSLFMGQNLLRYLVDMKMTRIWESGSSTLEGGI